MSEQQPPPTGGPNTSPTAPAGDRRLPGMSGRSTWVLLAVSLTAAVAGYVSAVSGARAPARPGKGEAVSFAGAAEPMPSYAELRDLRRGENGAMYAGAVAKLAGAPPDPATMPPKTEADWNEALARRSRRRAYAGAPPTIPHPIAQRDPSACYACHRDGATVGTKTAPLIGHARYESCVQCHVAVADAPPWATAGDGRADPAGPFAAGASFPRLASFGRGARAHAGAPPTIPHPTLMRSRCESCHGGKGLLGLRTPHPFQQSCAQCHAPSAALDQRVSVAEGPQ